MKPNKPLIALIVFVTAEGETVTPRFDPAAFRDTRWYQDQSVSLKPSTTAAGVVMEPS